MATLITEETFIIIAKDIHKAQADMLMAIDKFHRLVREAKGHGIEETTSSNNVRYVFPISGLTYKPEAYIAFRDLDEEQPK